MNIASKNSLEMLHSLPNGRKPDTKNYVACIAYRNRSTILGAHVFAEFQKPNWRRENQYSVNNADAEVVLVEIDLLKNENI